MEQHDKDLNLLLSHLTRLEELMDDELAVGQQVDPLQAHDRDMLIERIKMNLELT